MKVEHNRVAAVDEVRRDEENAMEAEMGGGGGDGPIRFGPMGGNLLQYQTPPTFLQDPAPFLSRVLPLSIDCYVHSI